MLRGKRRRRAVEARLGVDDQLDRDARHHLRVTSLEAEPVPEARAREDLAQPEPEPAGEHDSARPVRQRVIADETAERGAEMIHRGGCEAVLAGAAAPPDRAIVERLRGPLLPRRAR